MVKGFREIVGFPWWQRGGHTESQHAFRFFTKISTIDNGIRTHVKIYCRRLWAHYANVPTGITLSFLLSSKTDTLLQCNVMKEHTRRSIVRYRMRESNGTPTNTHSNQPAEWVLKAWALPALSVVSLGWVNKPMNPQRISDEFVVSRIPVSLICIESASSRYTLHMHADPWTV